MMIMTSNDEPNTNKEEAGLLLTEPTTRNCEASIISLVMMKEMHTQNKIINTITENNSLFHAQLRTMIPEIWF